MSTQPFDAARYKAGQRREWDTAAPGYMDWGLVLGPQLQPVSERMLELADIGPGQRVLDVATGPGERAVTTAYRVGPSGHVIATDLSPQMAALGRERGAELGLPNIDFREMDAEAPDLPEHSFEIVLCRFGLMFLPNPQGAL
jgi:ubiquinone/menaquinone biosynthesis C-methylase UbiE